MADSQGKQRERPAVPTDETNPEESGPGRITSLPELARRALSMGFAGFFMTEEAVRRALGDTLPKDWIDFAVDQSDRTRREFVERFSYEIGQSLERVDMAGVLSDLLEGRTLEVKAQIRLGPRGAEAGDTDVRLVTDDEQEQPGDRDEE
jgi:hypothetical protein